MKRLKILEEVPGMEEQKWYSSLPLPEVESLEPSLHAFVEAEDVESLDGVRLSLLAAAREQETALSKELREGNSTLAEETTKCLAEMNRALASLESSLINQARNGLDDYELEGPQNRDIQLRGVETDEKELLQTKIILVSEVAAAIPEWRAALTNEANSLIAEHKACEPISENAVKQLEANPAFKVVRAHGKIVASIKPPGRKKARLVACGNYLVRNKTKGSPKLDRQDVYWANMDTFSLRSPLGLGALRGWSAASVDVKTAFLTAPFQPESGETDKSKVVVVRVPRVMVQAGIFEPDTWLLVQGALYGLRESPHSWGVSRDSKLSKLQWSGYEGRSLELSQCEADVSM